MKNAKEFLQKRRTASGIGKRLWLFVKNYNDYRAEKGVPFKILDIGCGQNAELFNYINDEDEYTGCDFYESINVNVDNYFCIDLNEEQLDAKLGYKKFDVIFCGEVIEHLFSPDDLLEEIKNLMHKDSILILSTPNLAYIVNRFFLLLGISPLYLENSSQYKLGRKFKFLGQGNETEGHIRLFTFSAISDLLKIKKYEIVDIVGCPSHWNFFFDKIISKVSHSLAAGNVFVLKKQKENKG